MSELEEPVYCTSCGAKLPDGGGRFCPKCGKLFSGESSKESTVGEIQRGFPLSAVIVVPGILMVLWAACFASGGFIYFADGVNEMIGNSDSSHASFLVALFVAGALFDVGFIFSSLISYLGICLASRKCSTGAGLNELINVLPLKGLHKWGAWAYFLILTFGRYGCFGAHLTVSSLFETYLPEYGPSDSFGAFMLDSILVWMSAALVLGIAEGLFEVCSRLSAR